MSWSFFSFFPHREGKWKMIVSYCFFALLFVLYVWRQKKPYWFSIHCVWRFKGPKQRPCIKFFASVVKLEISARDKKEKEKKCLSRWTMESDCRIFSSADSRGTILHLRKKREIFLVALFCLINFASAGKKEAKSPVQVSLVLVLSLLMCVLSGLAALRKLFQADPADLF